VKAIPADIMISFGRSWKTLMNYCQLSRTI